LPIGLTAKNIFVLVDNKAYILIKEYPMEIIIAVSIGIIVLVTAALVGIVLIAVKIKTFFRGKIEKTSIKYSVYHS
jgi:hypothetical protein